MLLECPGCQPPRGFLLVSLKEYVIHLAYISIWSIESMLGEQVKRVLRGLFSFTLNAYYIVVLDTLIKAV